jgi:transcriptional regulator with XRE-family HTH domain
VTNVFVDYRIRVGKNIRTARKTAGLSHDALAAAVGTSRQHLIKLEKGQHLARPEMLARIADATKTTVACLESDDDEDDSSMPTVREDEFLEALRPLARLGARIDEIERLLAQDRS